MQRLGAAAAIALLIGLATLVIHYRGPWLAPFGMALGTWLIAGSVTELVERCQLGRIPVAAALRRLAAFPVRAGHGARPCRHRRSRHRHCRGDRLARGADRGDEAGRSGLSIAGLDVAFLGATPFTGPNYTAERGRFVVKQGGSEISTLAPEKRQFQPGRQVTSEVGLHQFLSGDLYIVMGEGGAMAGARSGSISIRWQA